MNATLFKCIILLLPSVILISQAQDDPHAPTRNYALHSANAGKVVGKVKDLLPLLAQGEKPEVVEAKLDELVSEANTNVAAARKDYPDEQLPKRLVKLYSEFDSDVSTIRLALAESQGEKGEAPAGEGEAPAGEGEAPAGEGEAPAGLGEDPAGLGDGPPGIGVPLPDGEETPPEGGEASPEEEEAPEPPA